MESQEVTENNEFFQLEFFYSSILSIRQFSSDNLPDGFLIANDNMKRGIPVVVHRINVRSALYEKFRSSGARKSENQDDIL